MPDIAANIREPSGVPRQHWPVTVGVPFPQGELRSHEHIAVLGPEGDSVPCCSRRSASWPDGSVRWALVDLQPTLKPMEDSPHTIRYGHPLVDADARSTPLRAHIRDEFVDVVTGSLAVRLARRGTRLIQSVSRGSQEYLASEDGVAGEPLLCAVDGEGTLYESTLEDVQIEEQSALRVVIRASGSFTSPDGARLLSWIARLYFFANHSFFKVYYTVVHDQPSRMVHLRRLSLSLNLSLRQSTRAFFSTSSPSSVSGGAASNARRRSHEFDPVAGSVALVQTAAGRCAIYESEGGIDSAVDAGHERCTEYRGDGHGWLHLADEEAGVTLKLRRSQQSYPKALRTDGSQVRLDLYPDMLAWRSPGREYLASPEGEAPPRDIAFHGPLQIPQGMARTHELYFHFGQPCASAGEVDRLALAFEQPLLLTLPAAHYAGTGALGPVQPFEPERWPLEVKLRKLCRPPNGRGVLNDGDEVEIVGSDEEIGTGVTENLAGDLPRCLLRQFLRTGDQTLFLAGEAAAMHLMDVDTIHFSSQHADWVGGQHVRHSVNHHYTDADQVELSGPRPDRISLAGLVEYYFLTGYERAREIAEQCADFCRTAAPYDWRQSLTSDAVAKALHPEQVEWSFRTMDVGVPLTGMGIFHDAFPHERFLRSMEALVDMLEIWQDDDGRWRDQIGSHNRGCAPAMTASVLRGLQLYHTATGDERARHMLIDGLVFLVRCGRTAEGIFRRDESPLGDVPDSESAVLLGPLAFVYGETADREALDAGYRLFRWLIDTAETPPSALADLLDFMPLLDRFGLLDEFRATDVVDHIPEPWQPRAVSQK